MAKSVYRWGSLWGISGFPFESGNGKLLTKIYASKGLLNQICRFLNLDQCKEFIRQEINWFEGDSIAE